MSQASLDEVEVAVIGGGIGGMACGVALVQAGRDVHVFEQAPRLEEVGGAIVALMGSADLLKGWGLLDGFLSAAVQMTAIEFSNEDGKMSGSGHFHGESAGDVLQLQSRLRPAIPRINE